MCSVAYKVLDMKANIESLVLHYSTWGQVQKLQWFQILTQKCSHIIEYSFHILCVFIFALFVWNNLLLVVLHKRPRLLYLDPHVLD